MTPSVVPIAPDKITLDGVRPLARTIHQDSRGFLMELLRKDDTAVAGHEFAMSYVSVTTPGEFRDKDRWHVHKIQTDRFVVPWGEMILALFDGRPTSPTQGELNVIRMAGAALQAPAAPARALPSALVPIPPGVYHCIGNLSPHPFVLANFPTELYNAEDEGRVPFRDVTVARLGSPFSWELVPSSRVGVR